MTSESSSSKSSAKSRPKSKSLFSGLLYSNDGLYNAVSSGDMAKAKKCLVAGISPDHCVRVSLDSLDFLDPLTGTWMTMLDRAITKGDVAMVQLLLEYDPDMTGMAAKAKAAEAKEKRRYKDKWATPSHYAARKGDKVIIELLNERGALDLQALDSADTTPMQMAILRGQTNVVRILLELGANVNATNGKGSTPLHVAALGDKKDIVKLLIDHDALADLSDFSKQTALMRALEMGHTEMVKLLVANGADLEVKNEDGINPFFKVAGNFDKPMMEFFLDIGADIEARDQNGCTALIRAVMAKNEALVRHLLDLGIDIDAQDGDGWTALYTAMVNQDETLARLLLDNGADILQISRDGDTLLHLAAKTSSSFVTRHLLARGVDVNARNERQETALHIASINGSRAVAHLLLAKAVDVSPKDANGWTPLQCAADCGHYAIMRKLVSKGADIDAQDTYSRKHIEEVTEENLKRIVRDLEFQEAGQIRPYDLSTVQNHPRQHPRNEYVAIKAAYATSTDVTKLCTKQGKSESKDGPSTVDPFEASIPKPAPTEAIIAQNSENGEIIKAGMGVAKDVVDIVTDFLGT